MTVAIMIVAIMTTVAIMIVAIMMTVAQVTMVKVEATQVTVATVKAV